MNSIVSLKDKDRGLFNLELRRRMALHRAWADRHTLALVADLPAPRRLGLVGCFDLSDFP